MRYVFRRHIPDFDRVLLIESGSRYLLEGLIPGIREHHRKTLRRLDLLTCFSGTPDGYDLQPGEVYRVTDYPNRPARKQLYRKLAANKYSVVVVICSGEPIMTKWKWALALRLRGKILILNENGDYFWLDRGNWRTVAHFAAFRGGLTETGAVMTLVRIAMLPLTVLYLLLYAATVHSLAALRSRNS